MPLLGPADGMLLLRLARTSIVEAVLGSRARLLPLLDEALARPVLRRPGAAFVTLRDTAELRGCVGCLEPEASLARCVVRYAVAAALADPRFPPLCRDELKRLRLEVSVLGPLVPIPSAEAIVVGRHGVELVHGDHRSVFLPQVAVEQGWDIGGLLGQLARKAGLREEDWRRASLSVFDTECLRESG